MQSFLRKSTGRFFLYGFHFLKIHHNYSRVEFSPRKDCIIVLSNVKYFVFRVVVIHFFFKQPLWMVVWDISLQYSISLTSGTFFQTFFVCLFLVVFQKAAPVISKIYGLVVLFWLATVIAFQQLLFLDFSYTSNTIHHKLCAV